MGTFPLSGALDLDVNASKKRFLCGGGNIFCRFSSPAKKAEMSVGRWCIVDPFKARLAGSFLRRYLVDIFERRERPNIARLNIDQMLPKPPQTQLIFQEVSAIFGRYFGGDISYIPTCKYVYIYFRKLRIYGICVFRVSQERVQIELRCCWWSLECTGCIS